MGRALHRQQILSRFQTSYICPLDPLGKQGSEGMEVVVWRCRSSSHHPLPQMLREMFTKRHVLQWRWVRSAGCGVLGAQS